jgi:hypothetical protein
MTNETIAQIDAALSDGAINEQELLDLVARGYVRAKQSIVERAVEAGLTTADIDAAVAKKR